MKTVKELNKNVEGKGVKITLYKEDYSADGWFYILEPLGIVENLSKEEYNKLTEVTVEVSKITNLIMR